MVSASPNIPDITGNWSGTSIGYDREGGYDGPSNWTFLVLIEEQHGRVFNGTIEYSNTLNQSLNGFVKFSGVIGPDLESIYMTEFDSGYIIGKIIDSNTLEFIYLDNIDGSATIDTITRIYS